MPETRKFPIPELNVLLIASHVVYGYVGNKTAAYVLQALGCNVSALNTVHFSNHTGYGQWAGTKLTGEEMRAVYTEGLKKNNLVDFDAMLTGYCPGAEAVEAAGWIARDIKHSSSLRPGSFFWLLDPVMGDNGKLYVDPGVVPVYRGLLAHADLIVPNQFELETLTDIKVDSSGAILEAIEHIHRTHRTAHVLVTSVRIPSASEQTSSDSSAPSSESTRKKTPVMSVIGSTRTSNLHKRAFRIDVPEFDCFFSGSGDLLASLMLVRLREAAAAANLLDVQSWISPDDVDAVDLPLAKAAEKALASMHVVLEKTMEERNATLGRLKAQEPGGGDDSGSHEQAQTGGGAEDQINSSSDKRWQRAIFKAAEVRIVRNVDDLFNPPADLFAATPMQSRTLPHQREEA